MSVIVKQKIEGAVDIDALAVVLRMAGLAVETPGHVTLHSSSRGTYQQPVDLHIPPDALQQMGLAAGRNDRYGLGVNKNQHGEVSVQYDRFYASRDVPRLVNKLGNLSKLAKLQGAYGQINVLYVQQADTLEVRVAAGQQHAAAKPQNAFMGGR
ncbi:MAG TPA: hypothetical protein VJ965_01490 [Anaerolineales bacterium]|nr:hypothetical protein [Anaerolineales bacterium]